MSQKYKNFSKGNGRSSACGSSLPPGVKRMGYLRKLKKMQRRFFVLHMESNYGIARLEYYGSEKKWKFGCEPRRCIELKSCLNISRKLHSKHKNVIALYTQNDCFSLVTESAEELDLWLNDLVEVQKTFMEVDENSRGRPIYEHLWQVVIDRHDLEYDGLLVGPYRVALSSRSLFLIKMNPINENDYFEFPLMSIRRCGHTKDHFFIELGRSAVIGAGAIYMATEGTIIAQNMHETVLSAMKSSKIREDGTPFPRPRSASTSENSNPVTTRRPIGLVAPQTVSSSASSCGLSNSRERCDSLPTRPQTITGNPHNCVLSALSSPYTSSGATFRRLNSRPHSMYEWPSCNSPSARNSSVSPGSISSTTACSSSTEEVDKTRYHSLSCHPHSYSTDGKKSADHPITEIPDEYLKMSLNNENKSIITDGPDKKKSIDVALKMPDYIDMKSSSIPKSESNTKLGNCLSASHGIASDNTPVKDGYLDMSPSNSLPKDASTELSTTDTKIQQKKSFFSSVCITSFRKEIKLNLDHKCAKEPDTHFELEKVLSLLKIEENAQSTLDSTSKKAPTVMINKKGDSSMSSSTLESYSDHTNRSVSEVSHDMMIGAKPPIPERTYHKGDYKSNIGPPLPMRKLGNIVQVPQQIERTAEMCKAQRNISTELQNKQDISLEIQIENSELDDQDVFYSNASNNIKTKTITSPENTNFSCFSSNERSNTYSLPCAPICSATKVYSDFKQNAPFNNTEQKDSNSTNYIHKNSINKFSISKNVCDNSELQLPTDSKVSPLCKSKLYSAPSDSSQPSDQNFNIPTERTKVTERTEGDYVNIDFKQTSSTLNQIAPGYVVPKNTTQLLPTCPNSNDPNYSNIQFGKPFCPTPKPIPASCEAVASAFNSSLKSERNFLFSYNPHPGTISAAEDSRGQKVLRSPTGTLNVCAEPSKGAVLTPKLRNIPNTLPAFRKQMSAPAGPSSLRAELPSPGRKSSCPVTASASMIRPSLPGTSISPMRPVLLQSHGTPAVHLRVSTSRSPDHSSVSSISSASDEISSAHSSPKTLTASQNFSVPNRQNISDSQYENVVIPQRSSTSSRPPSTSSEEKELNYALLDLTPSTADDVPRSPTIQKPPIPDNEETGTLTYAEIDFTKSEGLKNTSGSIREGRL